MPYPYRSRTTGPRPHALPGATMTYRSTIRPPGDTDFTLWDILSQISRTAPDRPQLLKSPAGEPLLRIDGDLWRAGRLAVMPTCDRRFTSIVVALHRVAP